MVHTNVVIIQSLEFFFKLTTCLPPGMKKKTLKIRFENNKELEPGFLKAISQIRCTGQDPQY
jgi:hypothetical protein